MQQEIDQFIQDTQKIAQEVKLNNWDVVQVMAEERQKQLEVFFAKPISEQDTPIITEMIHTIMEIDRQVMNQIVDEKNKTVSSFKNFSNHSKANQSYQHVASYSAG